MTSTRSCPKCKQLLTRGRRYDYCEARGCINMRMYPIPRRDLPAHQASNLQES